jgi:hypothetical protein
MGARDDVHAVDLVEAKPVDGPPEMSLSHPVWLVAAETLRGERDTPRLAERNPLHSCGVFDNSGTSQCNRSGPEPHGVAGAKVIPVLLFIHSPNQFASDCRRCELVTRGKGPQTGNGKQAPAAAAAKMVFSRERPWRRGQGSPPEEA